MASDAHRWLLLSDILSSDFQAANAIHFPLAAALSNHTFFGHCLLPAPHSPPQPSLSPRAKSASSPAQATGKRGAKPAASSQAAAAGTSGVKSLSPVLISIFAPAVPGAPPTEEPPSSSAPHDIHRTGPPEDTPLLVISALASFYPSHTWTATTTPSPTPPCLYANPDLVFLGSHAPSTSGDDIRRHIASLSSAPTVARFRAAPSLPSVSSLTCTIHVHATRRHDLATEPSGQPLQHHLRSLKRWLTAAAIRLLRLSGLALRDGCVVLPSGSLFAHSTSDPVHLDEASTLASVLGVPDLYSAIDKILIHDCEMDAGGPYGVVDDGTAIRVAFSSGSIFCDDASPALQDSQALALLDTAATAASAPPFGSFHRALTTLREMVLLPLVHSAAFDKIGIECPKGILLYGAPGCGKTTMVKAVARDCGAQLTVVHGPEIYGAYIGESEERLRNVFAQAAAASQRHSKPCMLFIDEIDTLCPKRGESSQHENRVVAQLLTLLDGMSARGKMIVIGATNRPNAIDPALRRPGRFDKELIIDVPSAQERLYQLEQQCKTLPLSTDALTGVSLQRLAEMTNGFVGADLAHLTREASLVAVERSAAQLKSSRAAHGEDAPGPRPLLPTITQQDFERAFATIVPSTQKSHKLDLGRTSWEDIGGMDQIKLALKQCIEWPLRRPDAFARLGLTAPRGILLYGPPGCSKTTLVRAAANSCRVSFLSRSGGEIYSPFVGEAERNVRELFQVARQGAPSLIFIDEIDAVVGKRHEGGGGSGARDIVAERVLSTLLNEMDGIEVAKNVMVIAATNRPDMLDAALVRPGRFDRAIYVPPPDRSARAQIFKVHSAAKYPVDESVSLEALADKTDGYTGADIEGVCKEAAYTAIRRHRLAEAAHASGAGAVTVTGEDFLAALKACPPSLSMLQLAQFEKKHRQWSQMLM